MPSAASRTITSRPATASARATAMPTTPAPTTTQSTFSISTELRPGDGEQSRGMAEWSRVVQRHAGERALALEPLGFQPFGQADPACPHVQEYRSAQVSEQAPQQLDGLRFVR